MERRWSYGVEPSKAEDIEHTLLNESGGKDTGKGLAGVIQGWFRNIVKSEEPHTRNAPGVTFTVTVETVAPPQVAHDTFTCDIAGVRATAVVPTEAKAECERLFRKTNRTDSENTYLHDNYWVNVYYKNKRHAYHGINDFWTYSARELPELSILHDWMYSVLGKNKPKITGDITTIKTWEEKGTIYALGTYASIRVQVSFKPKGFILRFLVTDDLRWEESASYNTKTGQGDFPFYYSDAQGAIIEWGKLILEGDRLRRKGAK